MPRRAPAAARAVLALALLAAFYLAAAALAGGLVLAVVLRLRHGSPDVADAAMLLLAGVVLRGTFLVRAPRFEPPGPELVPAEQPELFTVIRRVAARLGTQPPSQVYLVADVNAYVAEVGGFVGFGARRVMGIGLGLLCAETVSQLEATIAHELGHHACGGTRLGGVAYRSRAALAQLLASLDRSPLSLPFRACAAAYVRLTRGISRQQELAADRCGAEVAGVAAQLGALERASRSGVLFTIFLGEEVEPLLECGHRPDNLYDGFRAFEEELSTQGRVARVDAALAERRTDPDDSHPSLAERLAALRHLPRSDPPSDDRPARSLLRNAERIERETTARLAARAAPGVALEPVAWPDVATRVFGPRLAEEARQHVARISTEYGGAPTSDGALRTLAAALARSGDEAAALVLEPDLVSVAPHERAPHAREIVGRALGALLGASLVDRGGAWRSEVGRPLEVVIGAEVVAPYEVAAEALADRASLVEVVLRAVDAA